MFSWVSRFLGWDTQERTDLQIGQFTEQAVLLHTGASSESEEKVKDALRSLSKKIDIALIFQDPTLFPQENVKAVPFPYYSRYLSTQNKVPDIKLFIEYLNELDKMEDSSKASMTPSERMYINGRKTWSDVVSKTYERNKLNHQRRDADKLVVNRIKNLAKYDETQAKRIYHQCIEYLQNHSVIVMTFDASFLHHGLTDHQPLNMFEKNSTKNPSERYKKVREATEKKLFTYLESEIQQQLLSNSRARPHYAALMLLDRKQTVAPIRNYGNSFVVFKSCIKLNSLFVPMDSLDNRDRGEMLVCTFHHFSILLLTCTDTLLNALVHRVTQGMLPHDYSQQYEGSPGYIEVFVPPVNIFDCKSVEAVHIDPYEYKLSKEETKILARLNMTISNDQNPYPQLCHNFVRAIETSDESEVKRSLTIYPSLMSTTNRLGETPIHLAAKNSSSDILKYLVLYHADPSCRTPQGKTPLHLAAESNNAENVMTLLELPGVAHMAKLNGRPAWFDAVEKGYTSVVDVFKKYASADVREAIIAREVEIEEARKLEAAKLEKEMTLRKMLTDNFNKVFAKYQASYKRKEPFKKLQTLFKNEKSIKSATLISRMIKERRIAHTDHFEQCYRYNIESDFALKLSKVLRDSGVTVPQEDCAPVAKKKNNGFCVIQ